MSTEILNKYVATILLHALGDTIGFKKGEWEFFPDSSYGATLEKLYEFIDLGGINNINLENWYVSDDTILHMAIARSLILPYDNFDELEDNTVRQIIKSTDIILDEAKSGKNRYIGKAVERHVSMIKRGEKWKDFEYDPYGGGNGSAMRNNCIGLAFFGEENRNNLIRYSINSSKITHTNPIGWLGGLSTALFTAFIMENKNINEWIPLMINIIESDSVRKYLNNKNNEELQSYDQFIQTWKTYYDNRFNNSKPVKIKSHTNFTQRLIFYNNIFEGNKMGKLGLSGCSAVIVAYDCLLDAGSCWEKLVIYSMINNFDSDTIGAIAGGLYGTMYGLEYVPENNLEHIEYKNKLIKIGKLLYKKYFLHTKII